MGDDDGVPVARCRLRQKFAPVLALKVLLRRRQDVGARIEPVEVGRPLLHQVVRHGDHGLLGKAGAAQLHGGRNYRVRLAGAHHMVIQRGSILHRARDGVALVAAELDDFIRHLAGERHAVTVVHARDVVVVGVVVGAHQNLGTVAIGKQPVLELVPDGLGLLVGFVGCILIDVRAPFLVAVRHADRPVVQQCGQNVATVHLWCAVGRGVGDLVARLDGNEKAAVLLDVPDIGRRFVTEQVRGECLIHRLGHPWRSDARNYFAGRHILGLDFLQCADVGPLAGRDGLRQLGAHVARQVGVAQHVFIGRRVAEDGRFLTGRQFLQNLLRVTAK